MKRALAWIAIVLIVLWAAEAILKAAILFILLLIGSLALLAMIWGWVLRESRQRRREMNLTEARLLTIANDIPQSTLSTIISKRLADTLAQTLAPEKSPNEKERLGQLIWARRNRL